ncbi:hypothetical protein BGZ99_000287 [Dissophora globulifera]|uniref:Uncharacterized protein n=1 Tax=Dissophora globulifera TaxID=979702 RepID=A0A9P6UYA6_9FUNG|nr:hypothetical protein BGZ99_000287 [Dissophora globulifera]
MHFKTSSILVLTLALALSARSVHAQFKLADLLPGVPAPLSPGVSPQPTNAPTEAPPIVVPTTTTTTTTTTAPTVAPTQPTDPVPPPVIVTTPNPVVTPNPTTDAPKPRTTNGGAGGGSSIPLGSSTTSGAAPLSTNKDTSKDANSSGSTSNLATAGIVVGSVIVAAAIGIWVFRKWKLSPSRDFQSKIRGDDYQDYPRSYESDTVFLRNLGDQPTEPPPAKSPYNAHTTVPVEEQYYDANYTNDQAAAAAGYGHHEGYGGGNANVVAGGGGYDQAMYDHSAGYDHQTGYEHQGYGHGYDNPYGGHPEYSEPQISGGGAGYAPSNVGGGYANSNVGGGYGHPGYDEYGRR